MPDALSTLDVDACSPRAFERLVAVCWEAVGWGAKTTADGGDAGVDVVARRECPVETAQAVQVKQRASGNRVGSPTVRQAAGLYQQEDVVDTVVVVTSGTYTDPARETAARTGVKLVGRERLLSLVDHACERYGAETVRWLTTTAATPLLETAAVPVVAPDRPQDGSPPQTDPWVRTRRVPGRGNYVVDALTTAVGEKVGACHSEQSTLSFRIAPASGQTGLRTASVHLDSNVLEIRPNDEESRRRTERLGRAVGGIEVVSDAIRSPVALRVDPALVGGSIVELVEMVGTLLTRGMDTTAAAIFEIVASAPDGTDQVVYATTDPVPCDHQ